MRKPKSRKIKLAQLPNPDEQSRLQNPSSKERSHEQTHANAGSSGAAAAEAASKRRERITVGIHNGLSPLVEGWLSEGKTCVSITGSEKMSLAAPGVSVTTNIDRNFLSPSTAVTAVEGDYKRTVDTVFNRNFFSPNEVNSVITDAAGNVIERRNSEIKTNLFSPDTIDTKILAPDGTKRGSIHSDVSSDHIDTIVKDAAGRKVRQLRSEYDGNIFSPDTLCTQLKP